MMMMTMLMIRSGGGLTNTSAALTSIHDELTSRGRPDANWLGVVVTNRPSVDATATLAAARRARAAGITLLTVAVGPSAVSPEMAGIASWPPARNSLNVTDYDSLSAAEASLAQALCDS